MASRSLWMAAIRSRRRSRLLRKAAERAGQALAEDSHQEADAAPLLLGQLGQAVELAAQFVDPAVQPLLVRRPEGDGDVLRPTVGEPGAEPAPFAVGPQRLRACGGTCGRPTASAGPGTASCPRPGAATTPGAIGTVPARCRGSSERGPATATARQGAGASSGDRSGAPRSTAWRAMSTTSERAPLSAAKSATDRRNPRTAGGRARAPSDGRPPRSGAAGRGPRTPRAAWAWRLKARGSGTGADRPSPARAGGAGSARRRRRRDAGRRAPRRPPRRPMAWRPAHLRGAPGGRSSVG